MSLGEHGLPQMGPLEIQYLSDQTWSCMGCWAPLPPAVGPQGGAQIGSMGSRDPGLLVVVTRTRLRGETV